MKKIFLTLLKILGVLIALVIIAGVIGYLTQNESLPEAQKGPEADQVANQMLAAMDQAAWDSTYYVKWNFVGQHSYIWDRKRDLVQVDWGQNKVLLNTKDRSKSLVFVAGEPFTSGKKDAMIEEAWGYFCNDSFWLIAPFKVFDPGVERSIVTTDDGRKGLMASYTSGGTTPGDSYVWILGEDGLPTSYKMWTKIIPIGGVEATWEDWKTYPTGVKIASKHKLGPMDMVLSDIKASHDMKGLGLTSDPFKGM